VTAPDVSSIWSPAALSVCLRGDQVSAYKSVSNHELQQPASGYPTVPSPVAHGAAVSQFMDQTASFDIGKKGLKKQRPAEKAGHLLIDEEGNLATECALYAWQRPTLPPWQYHRRWSVSRPSSRWDRVGALRQNHQANKAHFKSGQVFIRRWCGH
jgi:hypothetical protein